MDKMLFHSIWTVVTLAVFVGIIFWAWSGKRKQDFEEAANLPLEDEEYISPSVNSGDKHNG